MTRFRFTEILGALALNLIGVAALCAAASSMPAAPATATATARVGSMLLERCAHVAAYCGRLDRPLDPTGAIPGRISIYFEFHPHAGSEAHALIRGTIGGAAVVAQTPAP